MDSKYGYTEGDIVRTRVPVKPSGKPELPAGTRLRIVVISPKIIATPLHLIDEHPDRYDSRVYFYNAVLADQVEPDYMYRVREHFVTLTPAAKPKALPAVKRKTRGAKRGEDKRRHRLLASR